MKTLTIIVTFFFSVVNGFAQDSMQERIGKAMQTAQHPTPETLLTCIAELKDVVKDYPDSIAPKQCLATQSITYALIAPTAPQSEALLASSKQMIDVMEVLPQTDKSDLNTLQGMYLMALIVQNPTQNGQRYFMQVMQHYKKALKLNPNNMLAQQMQAEFYKGMNR